MSEYRPTRTPDADKRTRLGGLTCWEFDNFIVDYLDGALSADQRHVFQAHLAACPLCRLYLDDYIRAGRAAKGAYKSDPAPDDAPSELIEAIVQALAAAPRREEPN